MASVLVHSVLVETSKLAGDLRGITNWKGNPYDPTMGSIKWLREALIAKGTDEDQAETLVKPFGELQFFRTKLAAHVGGAGAAQLRQDLLKEYGTPRQHIDSLAGRLSASLKDISTILDAHRLR